jgi:hypothetical protein
MATQELSRIYQVRDEINQLGRIPIAWRAMPLLAGRTPGYCVQCIQTAAASAVGTTISRLESRSRAEEDLQNISGSIRYILQHKYFFRSILSPRDAKSNKILAKRQPRPKISMVPDFQVYQTSCYGQTEDLMT